LSAPQLNSAGPTYNGHRERFGLMIAFFQGSAIPDAVQADLVAFAQRPAVIGTRHRQTPPPAVPDTLPPGGFLALPYEGGVVFHWETAHDADTTYRLRCRAMAGGEERAFTTEGGTLFVQRGALGRSDGFYTATVEALDPKRGTRRPSPEIRFRFSAPAAPGYEIPLDFKAKVLWANLSAWIRRHLL
jgi:hypothetical protein